MISIKSEGNKIIIVAEIPLGGKIYTPEFEMQRASQFDALLLRDKLREEYWRQVEEFGQHMYDKGFKEGRHHKEKLKWFPTNLKARFK